MNGSQDMTAELISGIAEGVLEKASNGELGYDILVCPPAPYLSHAVAASTQSALADYNDSIMVGSQNVNPNEKGAYTGEVSLPMLAEIGCSYVLLGHSERRVLFGENDQRVARKFAACVAALDADDDRNKVIPILCVGELLADRDAGKTEKVVSGQLDAVLEKVGIAGFKNAVIAYEPVWAIGTGKTATPQQAQDVHGFIRAKLAKLNETIANDLQIVYGGSVNPANAEELFAQEDIDGGLVGGAALSVENFSGICKAAETLSAS